jgi:hypothetical protein
MLGAVEAFAQRAEEPAIRSDIGLRRDSRLQAHDLGELRVLKALREVDWKLTLGIADTHAENGDQVTSALQRGQNGAQALRHRLYPHSLGRRQRHRVQ